MTVNNTIAWTVSSERMDAHIALQEAKGEQELNAAQGRI